MKAGVVSAPAPLFSLRFGRAYAVTMRPYLLFVSLSAGLVGIALAPVLPPWPQAVAASVAFFFAYGLGQALTDVFQTDTDALSSPYRPLVRGDIAGRDVLVVSLAGLFSCAAILAVLNPRTLLLSAASVVGLALYTPLKRRFWGGPAWNAGIVSLLPAMGLLAAAPELRLGESRLLPNAMASVFLTYAVFVILGYLKDVEADRSTGYLTLPVRFGRKAAVAVSALSAILGVVASLPVVLATGTLSFARVELLALGLWVAGVALLVQAHVEAFRSETDGEAYPAITSAVQGFVALQLGASVGLQPVLGVPALLVLLAFRRSLGARPCREQI